MIAVECVQCDHRWVADDHEAGRKVRCPNCNAKVKVEAPGPVAVQWHAGETAIRAVIYGVVGLATALLLITWLLIASR